MGCPEAAMPIPAVVFVLGILVLSVVVARRDRMGIKDAILVMIGMKRYTRNGWINAATLAVFVVPVILWVVLYEICQARG
ncbi:MAG: hypothetical protein AAGM21_08260 [Pseudomonadota bacterium]